jgi:hypothetical protein
MAIRLQTDFRLLSWSLVAITRAVAWSVGVRVAVEMDPLWELSRRAAVRMKWGVVPVGWRRSAPGGASLCRSGSLYGRALL